jgi:hypothetical protein
LFLAGHLLAIKILKLEYQWSQHILKGLKKRQKRLDQGGREKMGIRYQRIALSLFIEMGKCNTIGHLDSEPELIRDSLTIRLHILWARQFNLVFSKKGPKPLIYFHSVIAMGIFLKIVDALRRRIDQSVPRWVFPTTGAYSEHWESSPPPHPVNA